MFVKGVSKRCIPFTAVVTAAEIGAVIMPSYGSTGPAEFPIPTQISVIEAINRCVQEFIGPTVERMQCREGRGEAVAAVAAQTKPASNSM